MFDSSIRYVLFASIFLVSPLFGADAVSKLPLAFEKNQGQAGPSVDFLARGGGYSVFLSGGSARLALRHGRSAAPASVELRLAGARPDPKVATRNALPGKVNYFLGNDPSRWRTDIPTFGRVEYTSVYRGIDLAYYGNQGRLEYDFMVAPGARPDAIRLVIDGARNVHVVDSGDLVLEMEDGPVSFGKPAAYQEIAGTRQVVESHYVLAGRNEVRFAVGTYDPRQPLVIDPSLVYSTYLGGSSYDSASAIAVGPQGNAYVTGTTTSMDFPLVGAEQSFFTGSSAIFVSKLAADGSSLVYSTYLGGSGSDVSTDQANSIAVDSNGGAYVVGETFSTNFPVKNALYPTLNGAQDAFVTKFSPSGNALVYSTYLGGSGYDEAYGVAVDAGGNAYVTGSTGSTDFPVTANAYQTSANGSCSFVTKLNAAGSALGWSTYFAQDCSAQVQAIAVDTQNGVYLTGSAGGGLPVTANAPQPGIGGGSDAFMAKLSHTGAALVYCTYLGGSLNDYGRAIAVDSGGNAYVAGYTNSIDLPVTASAIQPASGGGYDGFVAKINSAGTAWEYLTYLGGQRDDYAYGIAVDANGNAIVAGNTNSIDFPRTSALQPTLAGNHTAIFKTTSGGSSWMASDTGFPSPVYYYGSIVVDPSSDLNLLAVTSDGGVYQSTNGGAYWAPNAFFTGNVYAYSLAFSPAGSVAYASAFDAIYSSADGGSTWALAGYLPFDPFCAALNITVDPSSASTLYTGGGSIYYGFDCSAKSIDGGTTWTVLSGLPSTSYVNGFAVDPNSPGTVYAASSAGLLKSADGGQTWSTLTIAALQSPSVYAVVIDPSQPAVVYAAANGSVYRSTNAGKSWSLMSTGLTDSVYYLAIAPFTPSVLYAGAVSGVFVTSNSAASWSPARLAQDQIYGIAVDPTRNGVAYAMVDVNPDAFVAKINAAGDKLAYSTYLGGSGYDAAFGVAVNSGGDVLVAGSTYSPDFPSTPGAFQPATGSPRSTSFVTRISANTPACSYSTSPASDFFYPAGGLANFSVAAPSGCAWTPAPSASWITVTSGAGPGVAPLAVSVAANTGAARSGTVTIDSASISISQAAGSCAYSLSTDSLTFPQAGGSQSIDVTATKSCHWKVTGVPLWLAITSGASGNGNGTVALEAAPNLFPGARPGYAFTISVANNPVTVSQTGTSGGPSLHR